VLAFGLAVVAVVDVVWGMVVIVLGGEVVVGSAVLGLVVVVVLSSAMTSAAVVKARNASALNTKGKARRTQAW
jgi:hypothetical protein